MLTTIVQQWKQFKNSRLYRRLPAEIPVRVRPDGTGPIQEMWITNWSPGGAYVRSSMTLSLYSMITLEFTLGTTGGSLLRLKGQVVRQNGTEKGETGMGIMFTDLTESGLWILRDFLMKESIHFDRTI